MLSKVLTLPMQQVHITAVLWRWPWYWNIYCEVVWGADRLIATFVLFYAVMLPEVLTLLLRQFYITAVFRCCPRCWKINHNIFLLQRCEAVPGAERLMAPGVFLLSHVTLSMLTCIYINWFMTWPRTDCRCISLQYSSSVHVANTLFQTGLSPHSQHWPHS